MSTPLRNAEGKVIGTMDGPGRGARLLFACNKTATDRMRLGCMGRRSLSFDEALIDKEDTEVADSAQARRVLAACAGTLDTNDMGVVIDMLVDAGKLNSSEAASLKDKLNPQSGGAEDRMFPHSKRLGMPEGYGMSSTPRTAHVPPMTAKDQAAYDEMFPNAGRLKL